MPDGKPLDERTSAEDFEKLKKSSAFVTLSSVVSSYVESARRKLGSGSSFVDYFVAAFRV